MSKPAIASSLDHISMLQNSLTPHLIAVCKWVKPNMECCFTVAALDSNEKR